jgi:hypothetical protein
MDGADEFVGEQSGGADLLPVLVQRGGGLKVERVAGGVALGGDLVEQGLATGAEEGEDALGFGDVLGGRTGDGIAFLTGHQALADVAVDAAGVFGIGREVLVTAAQLEEVEHGVAVAVGGGA